MGANKVLWEMRNWRISFNEDRELANIKSVALF